jgi:hypothetical protein
MKEQKQKNLLDLKPRRNLDWEAPENNLVVLLVPKFRNPLVERWFVPLLARPMLRVKLDPLGSAVWNRCDGGTSILEIGEHVAREFGEPLEPLYERIGKFIQKLARDQFLLLDIERTRGNS